MPNLKVTRRTREEYERLLSSRGEAGFYRYILGRGVIERVDYAFPEVLLLDRAEAFFAMARSTGNVQYFVIGRLLRKAAHRLYYNSRKSNIEHPINRRFLNIVK